MSEHKRFLTIEETAKQTGLSVYYLRQGIREGRIPCIKCGWKSMINIAKLIEVLDSESVNGKCRYIDYAYRGDSNGQRAI